MPNRVRKDVVAENTIYTSASAAPRQKPCSHRRRRVNTATKRKQITLTQFERGPPFDGTTIGDSQDENEDSPPRKKSKTRRSKLPGKTESQNTLTQIGWLSTIPPSDSEEDEELNETSPSHDDDEGSEETDEFYGFSDGDEIAPGNGSMDEEMEQHVKREGDVHVQTRPQLTPATSQPDQSPVRTSQEPPQTPKRIRQLEIPSSQSPLITPLSAIHTHERMNLRRSPLQPLSANPQSLLDTPSRSRKIKDLMTSPRPRSTRKRVAIKEQPFSSASRPTPQHHSHIPGSIEVDDSEHEDDEDVAEAVAGIDIGQETQAYIRRIDFVYASAQGTAEPGPSGDTDDEGDDSGLPQSSAHRSFNFDEELLQGPRSQPESSPPRGTEEETLVHDETPQAIKREPQTQQPWNAFQPTATHQQALPSQHSSPTNEHSSEVPRPSQISTVAGTTQHTPRSQASPTQPQQAPPHFSDDRISSSQPPQSIPQSPSPSQVSTVAGTTQHTPRGTQHRIPDSQTRSSPADQHVPSSSPVVGGRVGHGRREREVNGAKLVTATQLLSGGVADYSLPPPPPWTQDSEDEDEDEE